MGVAVACGCKASRDDVAADFLAVRRAASTGVGAIRHDFWCVGWQKPNKGSGRELNEACRCFSGEKQTTALLR